MYARDLRVGKFRSNRIESNRRIVVYSFNVVVDCHIKKYIKNIARSLLGY